MPTYTVTGSGAYADETPLPGTYIVRMLPEVVGDNDGTWRGGKRKIDSNDDGSVAFTLEATKPGEFYTLEFVSRDSSKTKWPGAPFAFTLTANRTIESIIEFPAIPTDVAEVGAVLPELARKDGSTYTGTHNFAGATVLGVGGNEVRSDTVHPYTYMGAATTGTTETAPTWRIRRIATFDPYIVTEATGAWTDRLTLTYA